MQKKKVNIAYYQTNIQNMYNFNMNSVDISDQLRSLYGFQHWVRNIKWWWALFMWVLCIILVNAYMLYKTAHLYIWCTDKKDIMSQYEFRKAIALAWIHEMASTRTAREPQHTPPRSNISLDSRTPSLASSRTRRNIYEQTTNSRVVNLMINLYIHSLEH